MRYNIYSGYITRIALEEMRQEKALTELVILDRSGSMSSLESDTIGGYNSLLKKQRKEVGAVIITTVLFDDKYEFLQRCRERLQ